MISRTLCWMHVVFPFAERILAKINAMAITNPPINSNVPIVMSGSSSSSAARTMMSTWWKKLVAIKKAPWISATTTNRLYAKEPSSFVDALTVGQSTWCAEVLSWPFSRSGVYDVFSCLVAAIRLSRRRCAAIHRVAPVPTTKESPLSIFDMGRVEENNSSFIT